MNSSILSADTNTHMRIVAVSLVAAIAVVTVGMNARVSESTSLSGDIAAVELLINAGEPVRLSATDISTMH